MLSAFSNLPRPVQAVSVLGFTTGATSVGMAALGPKEWRGFFTIVAIGIIGVALLVALYLFILKMRDKSKSGPFASLIAKAGGGRGAVDPAQKARMDDLRKKFEEGVSTFKSAGKDLYSLPWYLLVGPSGSGKTEAMRHCNVGFPPGLQDCLQGTGGTMNMHWWFTNSAVVLDTAGRMFMEEGADSQSTEWKEFMKLLKDTRPNAPINGMLLVISAESLLKDSADKIEKTAGAIARQLDVVQRTLDVRFPVFVVVTKCDKIVGFREFFETLNDPALQHQMLGWSNPAPLDEVFKPDEVGRHLESVRERLHKRRMGLLQNPIHTSDPNARRTDQVDEMFELPDNLVRIAPRLKRYLEMIFVAGEWSPKPLFLRGIYFTSSMREGQALDVSLAQALGIDVDSIPGGKEWDKDKAYFLRDVFVNKVFKEKGLVTRAVNVSKTLAKQRRLVFGISTAAVLLLTAVGVVGWLSFSRSIGPPSVFWTDVRRAYVGDENGEHKPLDIRVINSEGKGWAYRGGEVWKRSESLDNEKLATPADIVVESAAQARKPIHVPVIALPLVGLLPSQEEQVNAHRAVVERSVVGPLVTAARSKVSAEQNWTPAAVAALAQLIRLETYALGGTPANVEPKAKGPVPAADAEALFKYVLGDSDKVSQAGFEARKTEIIKAVNDAYPGGWGKPADVLAGKDEASIRTNERALENLAKDLKGLRASPGSQMASLLSLLQGLSEFRQEEKNLMDLAWFQAGPTAPSPQTVAEYTQFQTQFLAVTDKLAAAREKAEKAASALGAEVNDVPSLFTKASGDLRKEMKRYFDDLRGELPTPPDEGKSSKIAPELLALRSHIDEKAAAVNEEVEKELGRYAGIARDVGPMTAMGRTEKGELRAFAARGDAYKLAADEVRKASLPPAAPGAADAPAGGLPPSVAVRVDEVDKATAQLVATLTALGAWNADAAASGDLTAGRNASVAASRRAIEIARGRRLYELARQAITAWPTDVPGIGRLVAATAADRINSGAFENLTRPQVTLSDMAKGAATQPNFQPEFHPAAAKEVLTDWARVRELVEPSSGGNQRQVVGREELRTIPSYQPFVASTTGYVKSYLEYWQAQATTASRPSAGTWAEFSAVRLVNGGTTTINGALATLAGVVKDQALPAVPPSPAWNDQLTATKAQVQAAFIDVANPTFLQATTKTYANWSELGKLSAERARSTLMDSLKIGKIKEDYFNTHSPPGQGTAYWNGFIENGLETLIHDTQGNMEEARKQLIADAKGVPLAVGPNLPDIPLDTMRKICGNVEKLSAMASPDQSVPGVDTLGEGLRRLMTRLSGAELLSPSERQWFAKVNKLVQVFGQDRAAMAFISYWADAEPPKVAGMTKDATQNYRYAALHVGGQPRGKVFSLLNAPSEQALKLLHVDVPGGVVDQPVEIFLWEQPQGDVPAPPDARVVLPGPWSVLRPMVTAWGETKYDQKTRDWRVLAPVQDKPGVYLWVRVHFEEDKLAPTDWPSAEQWPNR